MEWSELSLCVSATLVTDLKQLYCARESSDEVLAGNP